MPAADTLVERMISVMRQADLLGGEQRRLHHGLMNDLAGIGWARQVPEAQS
jgi:hypothetical protein